MEFYSIQDYPDSDKTIFLFIGRIMKEKGVDELLDATKRLIDCGWKVELHVLGRFEEEYSDKFEQYSREEWLCYHGYSNDVRPYIKQASCFVLPS